MTQYKNFNLSNISNRDDFLAKYDPRGSVNGQTDGRRKKLSEEVASHLSVNIIIRYCIFLYRYAITLISQMTKYILRCIFY